MEGQSRLWADVELVERASRAEAGTIEPIHDAEASLLPQRAGARGTGAFERICRGSAAVFVLQRYS